MNVLDRFLNYVRVDTVPCEECEETPSSKIQFDLANKLAEELISIGVADAYCDEKCYVYGHIPATAGLEGLKKIGFVAHMDTAPDFNGYGVSPRVIENYDGGDIALGTSGRVLSNAAFPHISSLAGKTLVVTDGTSLLGGDDKAGIAEIMTALEYIILNNIPHCGISVCFTPDEEVGRGADEFSLEKFGADFAYTIDGGIIDAVEYENFNACGAVFEISGFNVHPGDAKDTMINAAAVACEINSLLPAGETPRDTAGYEGFYHLCDMSGSVEAARLEYIVRDHDMEKFEKRKRTLAEISDKMNAKYGKGSVKLTVKDSYFNMAEIIKKNFHLVENALAAINENGLCAKTLPIRGGTDGARLSFMGLPCPNLGTGTYAGHGPYEHICAEDMEKMVQIIVTVCEKYSK